jgi:hypothetical protein
MPGHDQEPPVRYRLLERFEATFRAGPYLHRNSQLGNRIADFLFDDLYVLREGSRYRRDVDAGHHVLNPKGVSPGLRARRGDGSFGSILPGYVPRRLEPHLVGFGPTASPEIGAEVKILAKAMIKQIDRVISDLCGQASHFHTKNPHAVSVGIVGVNEAETYVSYEGERAYPTGPYGPHPVQEAQEARHRLDGRADGCFDEFLVLRFRASNVPPYPFEWVDRTRTGDAYGAMLLRLLRRYEG